MRGQCEIGSKFSAPYEYRRAKKITLSAGGCAGIAACYVRQNDRLSLNQSFSVFVNELATNPI